jgi:hypothetical protein
LFEDANQGRARLEIANNPGTDDQDAFDGCMLLPFLSSAERKQS